MDKVVKSNFIAFNDVQFVGRVFHHHHQWPECKKTHTMEIELDS